MTGRCLAVALVAAASLAAAVLLGAALLLEEGARAGPEEPAAIGQCHARALDASLHPRSPGAGQRYAVLRLHNRGARACVVAGYAGAQLLAADDRPVPTQVVRDRSRAPRRVRLRPGQYAAARWHWTVIPSAAEPVNGPCQPLARIVVITPPGAKQSLRRSWSLGRVCDHDRIEERPFAGPHGSAPGSSAPASATPPLGAQVAVLGDCHARGQVACDVLDRVG